MGALSSRTPVGTGRAAVISLSRRRTPQKEIAIIMTFSRAQSTEGQVLDLAFVCEGGQVLQSHIVVMQDTTPKYADPQTRVGIKG